MLIYPIGVTDSCKIAVSLLKGQGIPITDHPCPEITHLMLDVPAFLPGGELRSGDDLKLILSMLPQEICIIGGNLEHPLLERYVKINLLKDPGYLANNARITADCALRLAGGKIKCTFSDAPALIIGWGRIGKCLGQMLKAIGCPVTIAARKEQDRALARALGYDTVSISDIGKYDLRFHLIFNTVPATLPECRIAENAYAFELASSPGLLQNHSISAKGLPALLAPESSGQLIAQTIARLCKEA